MTYRLIYTSSFKKDVRLAEKRHLDMNALAEVLEWLKSGKKLPEKYCDHQLKQIRFFKIQRTNFLKRVILHSSLRNLIFP